MYTNMKSSESYKITAVRLVEFHNFGTTIEIPEDEHLFLLGDAAPEIGMTIKEETR